MKRVILSTICLLVWAAWLDWGIAFMRISYAFSGSYWEGLPEQGTTFAGWLVWIATVALVYVLPLILLALIPTVVRVIQVAMRHKKVPDAAN